MQDARDIRPLTSLRFFAAMWVVAFHYWPNLTAAWIGKRKGPGAVVVVLPLQLTSRPRPRLATVTPATAR